MLWKTPPDSFLDWNMCLIHVAWDGDSEMWLLSWASRLLCFDINMLLICVIWKFDCYISDLNNCIYIYIYIYIYMCLIFAFDIQPSAYNALRTMNFRFALLLMIITNMFDMCVWHLCLIFGLRPLTRFGKCDLIFVIDICDRHLRLTFVFDLRGREREPTGAKVGLRT